MLEFMKIFTNMGLFIFIFITSLCIDILIIFSIVKGMINRIYGEID